MLFLSGYGFNLELFLYTTEKILTFSYITLRIYVIFLFFATTPSKCAEERNSNYYMGRDMMIRSPEKREKIGEQAKLSIWNYFGDQKAEYGNCRWLVFSLLKLVLKWLSKPCSCSQQTKMNTNFTGFFFWGSDDKWLNCAGARKWVFGPRQTSELEL